jgi:hypothetical protein
MKAGSFIQRYALAGEIPTAAAASSTVLLAIIAVTSKSSLRALLPP